MHRLQNLRDADFGGQGCHVFLFQQPLRHVHQHVLARQHGFQRKGETVCDDRRGGPVRVIDAGMARFFAVPEEQFVSPQVHAPVEDGLSGYEYGAVSAFRFLHGAFLFFYDSCGTPCRKVGQTLLEASPDSGVASCRKGMPL